MQPSHKPQEITQHWIDREPRDLEHVPCGGDVPVKGKALDLLEKPYNCCTFLTTVVFYLFNIQQPDFVYFFKT
jgi:hypothetical protein